MPSVAPNRGVEAAYRRELQRLIDAMQKDVLNRITPLYEKGLSEEALDNELKKVIAGLADTWDSRFDREAARISKKFLRQLDQHTASTLHAQFKTINADYKARRTMEVDTILQKAVERNVALIKSIPEQFHRRVQAMAASSLSHNRDLHFLKKSLQGVFEITQKRAELIARDQANKVTNDLAVQRSLAVGITEGIWQHVPGKYSSRKTHLKMDGQKFDLSQGLYDSDAGQFVKPGELIACNCRYRPVIPGFGD